MAVALQSDTGKRRSQGSRPNTSKGAITSTSARWWITRTVKKVELSAHSGDTSSTTARAHAPRRLRRRRGVASLPTGMRQRASAASNRTAPSTGSRFHRLSQTSGPGASPQ